MSFGAEPQLSLSRTASRSLTPKFCRLLCRILDFGRRTKREENVLLNCWSKGCLAGISGASVFAEFDDEIVAV